MEMYVFEHVKNIPKVLVREIWSSERMVKFDDSLGDIFEEDPNYTEISSIIIVAAELDRDVCFLQFFQICTSTKQKEAKTSIFQLHR